MNWKFTVTTTSQILIDNETTQQLNIFGKAVLSNPSEDDTIWLSLSTENGDTVAIVGEWIPIFPRGQFVLENFKGSVSAISWWTWDLTLPYFIS